MLNSLCIGCRNSVLISSCKTLPNFVPRRYNQTASQSTFDWKDAPQNTRKKLDEGDRRPKDDRRKVWGNRGKPSDDRRKPWEDRQPKDVSPRQHHRHPEAPHDHSRGDRGTFDWGAPKRKPGGYFERGGKGSSAFLRPQAYIPPPELNPDQVPEYFAKNVRQWSESESMQHRLLFFGIPQADLQPLLTAFIDAVESGYFNNPTEYKYHDLNRFAQTLMQRQSSAILYSNIFFSWATQPSQRAVLIEKYNVNPATLTRMMALVEVTDRRYLAEEYAETRRMTRKIIMHVGPTNSGKTHNALRALAASRMGVYAGPLRLLAHEIWERLNLGQIPPLGTEDGSFVNPDTEVITTLPHADTVKQFGKLEYSRLTNMITGEEQKVVVPMAPLTSCTVEMLGFTRKYDVAVVDEIQMITDPQRGSAWTSAVLGLAAKEVHLCGEETVVPIIRELLKDTGDELIVNRYERLTPLTVEEHSLEGDYSKVRKGDCIVTFDRASIFNVKRRVESMTGLRCAVVYGRLPPEIRSEQADLFNNPDSGYDVLVGSDAIGMGLNLKIRRIIFDSVRKYTPSGQQLLSISQVKQIAGRAGRFGMHQEPGGYATTLLEDDLPFLKTAVASPFVPVPFARATYDAATFAKLLPLLPPDSTTATVVDAHHFIGKLPSNVRHQDSDAAASHEFLDTYAKSLTSKEWVLYLHAPVPWRDPNVVAVMRNFMDQTREGTHADLEAALKTTIFMDTMERYERVIENGRPVRCGLRDLSTLESFHKSLVLYIWMSFRAPVMYCDAELATTLKIRLEKVLQQALEGMSEGKVVKLKEMIRDPSSPGQSPRVNIPYASKYNKARTSGEVESSL
ncbi:ATP-dependent RNA helicase suv3 [Coprinopsis marcescibilis]|uniref:RNA helicase n=1 Tax=Coprinopsis marcescibilis TaxID=230819 RepID=A0A5C3KVJ5_COPMA|nr:ATP-dependent RNA helicase suv3 [Coprinopsis marcescibilis]